MKIKIEEQGGKLYVYISIPSRETGAQRKRVILRDVRKILQEKKIKYGKCIASPTVTNRDNRQLSGTFIFEIPQPAPKPKPKPKPTTKRVTPKPQKRRTPTRRKKTK